MTGPVLTRNVDFEGAQIIDNRNLQTLVSKFLAHLSLYSITLSSRDHYYLYLLINRLHMPTHPPAEVGAPDAETYHGLAHR